MNVESNHMDDRVVKEVSMPPRLPLPSETCFHPDSGKPNIRAITQWFQQEGRLKMEDLVKIIDLASAILIEEPNMLEISSPITVCGDIHGQYYDLLTLFSVGGDPESTSYLFLGDYVDRGSFSVECVILLYCYKIHYPDSFYLLRGNHECRHLAEYFTFHDEVLYKYNTEVYEAFMDSFDCLPLCALLNQQFFCVHGGISPDIEKINEINGIYRFREPPSSGPMCDLLWSDPAEDYEQESEFVVNEQRACSYCYTYSGVLNFLQENDLLAIIRAHEAQEVGYRMHKKTQNGFPSVITIFSAPNYLGTYANKGAILRYENDVFNIKPFTETEHPFVLPSFANVFEWSMPFVTDKILAVLEALSDEDQAEDNDQKANRFLFDQKLQYIQKILSASNSIKPIGSRLPDDFVTRFYSEPLAKSIFEHARSEDSINEKRPPEKEDGLALKSMSMPGPALMKVIREKLDNNQFD